MVHFKGANNEAPSSGSTNISFQITDENDNLIHKVWNTGGGNSDVGKVYYAGKMGINEISPQSILDVRSEIGPHPLGAVFRKDYGGSVSDASHKLAITVWGQDHDDLDHTSGTDFYGPMIGFGARNDDSAPNTGDVRAGISYVYNGGLTFHTEAGGSVSDGTNERMRIHGGGYVTKSDQPLFLTHSTGVALSSNNDNLLTIANAYQNVGSHYKTSGSDQGKFIAPVAGIYWFYCMYTGQNSVSAPVIGFKVNGSFTQNFALNYNATYDGTFMGQTISLSANDYVQCSMRDWNGQTPDPWNTWWGGWLQQ